MKMWGCRDADGTSNLVRSDAKPKPNHHGRFDSSVIARASDVAILACDNVARGGCREINLLNLWNWTVEYVPGPPTLKEAWKEFKDRPEWEIRTYGGSAFPYRNLIDALIREFPDE